MVLTRGRVRHLKVRVEDQLASDIEAFAGTGISRLAMPSGSWRGNSSRSRPAPSATPQHWRPLVSQP